MKVEYGVELPILGSSKDNRHVKLFVDWYKTNNKTVCFDFEDDEKEAIKFYKSVYNFFDRQFINDVRIMRRRSRVYAERIQQTEGVL